MGVSESIFDQVRSNFWCMRTLQSVQYCTGFTVGRWRLSNSTRHQKPLFCKDTFVYKRFEFREKIHTSNDWIILCRGDENLTSARVSSDVRVNNSTRTASLREVIKSLCQPIEFYCRDSSSRSTHPLLKMFTNQSQNKRQTSSVCQQHSETKHDERCETACDDAGDGYSG